jgi:exodeoxyribonuclease V alpha subunit
LGIIDGVVWFAGRPVIVTQNDPLLKLFNGDIGIALLTADQQLMVYFEDAGGVRAIAPGRLPNCETALALTIHKSQGSEFERIDIILPPEDSPLAARELIYTAVTRARQSVRLWGEEKALAAAIGRPTVRYSALGERLKSQA